MKPVPAESRIWTEKLILLMTVTIPASRQGLVYCRTFMMKTTSVTNPVYCELEGFIRGLPETIENLGSVMFSRRNEIRLTEVSGHKLVIKSFRRINVISRALFAVTGVTKARMAYENALRLLEKGISTPDPVGFTDIFRNGLAAESYYVCLFTDATPAAQLFSAPLDESIAPLKAFARFTFLMHSKGVFHEDYNLGNVFYTAEENGYQFSLVDINRVRFYEYSFSRGLKNLRRLYLPDERLNIIGTEYALASRMEVASTVGLLFQYQEKFRSRIAMKTAVKKIIRKKERS